MYWEGFIALLSKHCSLKAVINRLLVQYCDTCSLHVTNYVYFEEMSIYRQI